MFKLIIESNYIFNRNIKKLDKLISELMIVRIPSNQNYKVEKDIIIKANILVKELLKRYDKTI